MNVVHHERGRDPHYKIWHMGDRSLLLYTYSNGGSIVFQDAVYPIQKGALCLIAPGKLHYTVPSEPAVYDRSKFFLSEDKKSALLSLIPNDSSFFRLFAQNAVVYALIPEEEQGEVESLFFTALSSQSENAPEHLLLCLLRLLLFLKKHAVHSIPTPKGALSRAIDYINKNYTENISLTDICAHIHTSKYYFCRRFKDAMGITVMEYLLKTRLAAARLLLAEGRMSIGCVAEKCGFSGASYFCQAFKRAMGVTASDYRRAARLEKKD